jgi:APA family basic amino acid/polyamine antiporter
VFIVVTLYNDISNYLAGKTEVVNAAIGLVLTLMGLPLYWFFKSRGKKAKLKM